MQRFKNISIIAMCWAVVFFLGLLVVNTIHPSRKLIRQAGESSMVKMDKALDSLLRIENNLEKATAPSLLEENLFLPLRRAGRRIDAAADNLEQTTRSLAEAAPRVQTLLIQYRQLGENLEKATRPELVDARLYRPLEKNFTDLSRLIEELEKSACEFREMQARLDERLPRSVEKMGSAADEISSGVQALCLEISAVAANLEEFSRPKNLNTEFSLREAARYISMPLSKSSAETDRVRVIIGIDAIVDEDMRKEGFQVVLRKKGIMLDDFNAFQSVRIDSLSLVGEEGRKMLERWQALVRENPESSFEVEDYMKWVFSIRVLQKISNAGVHKTEEVDQLLDHFPKIDPRTDIDSPQVLRAIMEDRLMRRLKGVVSVKKIYPNIRSMDLPMALKIPLAPLNMIRREIY